MLLAIRSCAGPSRIKCILASVARFLAVVCRQLSVRNANYWATYVVKGLNLSGTMVQSKSGLVRRDCVRKSSYQSRSWRQCTHWNKKNCYHALAYKPRTTPRFHIVPVRHFPSLLEAAPWTPMPTVDGYKVIYTAMVFCFYWTLKRTGCHGEYILRSRL